MLGKLFNLCAEKSFAYKFVFFMFLGFVIHMVVSLLVIVVVTEFSLPVQRELLNMYIVSPIVPMFTITFLTTLSTSWSEASQQVGKDLISVLSSGKKDT